MLSATETLMVMLATVAFCATGGVVGLKHIHALRTNLLEQLWTIARVRSNVQIGDVEYVTLSLMDYRDVPIRYKWVRVLYVSFRIFVIWPTAVVSLAFIGMIGYTAIELIRSQIALGGSISSTSSVVIVVGHAALLFFVTVVFGMYYLYQTGAGTRRFVVNEEGRYEVQRVRNPPNSKGH